MAVDPNAFNAITAALNSDAGKALTLPVAHEVGQLMGDVANIVRFYTTDNLGKVFTRWDQQRVAEGRILTAGDVAKQSRCCSPQPWPVTKNYKIVG